MGSGSTRWRRARLVAGGVLGGAAFGAMFSSIAAGLVAATVIAVCLVDGARVPPPPPDDTHTLRIDLDRR